MGKAVRSSSRKEAAIAVIAEKIVNAEKLIEGNDYIQIDIFTGYLIDNKRGKYELRKIDRLPEMIASRSGLFVNIDKNGIDTRISLISVIPMDPEKVIDSDEVSFDYARDNIFDPNYLNIAISVMDKPKHLEKALKAIINETIRILKLYSRLPT